MKCILLISLLVLTACGGGDEVAVEPSPQEPVLAWTISGKIEGDFCSTRFSCGAGEPEMTIEAKVVNGKCTVPPATIAGFCPVPKGH